MEKRRRKTGELTSTARGVASDAESTVSTRSSNSSNSSTSWKQKQRRLKTNELRNEVTQRKSEKEAEGQLKSLETTLGEILETTEVQMVMILLIALDVGCTALEIHFHDQQQLIIALQQLKGNSKDVQTDVTMSLLLQITTRLVESFTGFTLFLFLIELIILLAVFRRNFFAHTGYVFDLVVVSLSLAVELYAQTKAVRLLGVLRVWRVLRLVRRLVDEERTIHDTTRLILEQEQMKLLHVRMQKDAAHESLKLEYESREGLEQLLRGYKDEIVTLKEALQIAAQAVAEATMNENTPVSTDLYEISEYGYKEEYSQQNSAELHPTKIQTEVKAHNWQENYHQEVAEVHPTELQNFREEMWQKSEKEAVVASSVELTSEHDQEDRDEFEDAVDE